MNIHPLASLILSHAQASADRIGVEINRTENLVQHINTTNDALVLNLHASFADMEKYLNDTAHENMQILRIQIEEMKKLREDVLNGTIRLPEAETLSDSDVTAITSRFGRNKIPLEVSQDASGATGQQTEAENGKAAD